MLQGKPYLAAMPLGSMIITQYEKQGARHPPARLRAPPARLRAPCTRDARAMHVPPCACAVPMRCACRAGAHIVRRLLNMRDEAAACFLQSHARPAARSGSQLRAGHLAPPPGAVDTGR